MGRPIVNKASLLLCSACSCFFLLEPCDDPRIRRYPLSMAAISCNHLAGHFGLSFLDLYRFLSQGALSRFPTPFPCPSRDRSSPPLIGEKAQMLLSHSVLNSSPLFRPVQTLFAFLDCRITSLFPRLIVFLFFFGFREDSE